MKKTLPPIVTMITLVFCDQALAHTSEQGFVLLLPTDIYISAGVLAVLFTIMILAALPSRLTRQLFNPARLLPVPHSADSKVVTSLLSLCALLFLITVGFIGSHDPLKNLLPLTIWTVWWIGFVFIQGILGNLWRWVDPWSGLFYLARQLKLIKTPVFNLPGSLGVWPAIVIYLVFSAFALADVSPEDPPRLALIVSMYWLLTFIAMMLFGKTWLQQGECFTVLLERIAHLAPMAVDKRKLTIGLPGWQQLAAPHNSLSAAILILTLLAVGSFDGLNETFWWLAKLGINVAAVTDPLQNGRDFLGLGRFYVTTGFFNTQETVRIIWLTQAGAVVLGHIFSVLMAHVIAGRLWKNSRQALLSQLPLSVFMVLYTLLGLWLLAAPRGA